MKFDRSILAGTILSCLPWQIATAPATGKNGTDAAAVIACARKALKGDNIDYRLVTAQSDTYASASKGDILYEWHIRCETHNAHSSIGSIKARLSSPMFCPLMKLAPLSNAEVKEVSKSPPALAVISKSESLFTTT